MEFTKDYSFILKNKQDLWMLKSRINWLIEGDRTLDSSIPLLLIEGDETKSTISRIRVSGSMINKASNSILSFYTSLFKTEHIHAFIKF